MFMRDRSTTTLLDVAEKWNTRTDATWGGGLHKVKVRLTPDEELDDTDEDGTPRPVTSIIALGEHEVPATKIGLASLASYLQVPTAFLARVSREEQEWILNSRIDHSAESDVSVTYSNTKGLSEIIPSGARRIRPGQIASLAMNVLPAESTITDHWATPTDLRLDAIVPEGFDRGWGGDPKVGDITGGGVRLFQNRKQNLVPGVQPFFYRLVCTNGMEMVDDGMKVDARGLEVEEVLAQLEIEARRAFDRVEADIAAFYDTRSQKVGPDRTGELRQIALDAGLPSRTVGRLEGLLPEWVTPDGDDITEASMFDFINLVTNYANAGVAPGTSRELQRVGGTIIGDHAARCTACHRKVL